MLVDGCGCGCGEAAAKTSPSDHVFMRVLLSGVADGIDEGSYASEIFCASSSPLDAAGNIDPCGSDHANGVRDVVWGESAGKDNGTAAGERDD